MKLRILLLPIVAVIAIALGVQAQDGRKKEDQTELGAHMEKIGGAWRKLRSSIADSAKNEENLKNIAIVHENMQAALQFEPALTKEKPAADQQKFVADYRAKLKEEIAKVEKIEAALKAGNNEEAAKLYGVVGEDQKDAHKEFRKQKKKMG